MVCTTGHLNCYTKIATRQHHTGLSPCLMVCDADGYTSWSSLDCIDGILDRARDISGVFRPFVLPFIQALRNPTFQQDNTRPPVVGIVRTFLDVEDIRLSS
ncbi:transposable element Tcb1 transposase [Trichonephila clavipes]|nr:transposable element Tcb1 transposase [Trichonephila clavipes]